MRYGRASCAFRRRVADRRGISLVMVVLTVVALATLSIGFLTVGLSRSAEQRGMKQELAALYVAQAGLSDSFVDLQQSNGGNLGTADAPVAFANGSYWVERSDLAGGMVSLVSSGISQGVGARVEMVLARESDSLFQWGVFGTNGVTLSSNARLDGYNSSLGTYESQAVNGNGSNQYALSNCTTGSNGSITLSQNAVVHGDVVPGPESTANVIGNATVSGSTASATTLTTLPELVIPTFGSQGNLLTANGSTINIPSGDIEYDQLRVGTNATLYITGPARLVCQDLVLRSGSKIVVDATNGPVELYSHRDFVLNSNTSIASLTKKPADVGIFLGGTGQGSSTLNLGGAATDSNVKVWATIFAPNAKIDLKSNFELFGALIAKLVNISSQARVHFDADLVFGQGANVTYTRILWRKLAFPPL